MTTLRITSLSDVKAVLVDPSVLSSAKSIWLSNFSCDNIFGAYTCLERSQDAQTRQGSKLPWRRLMAALGDRCEANGPLDTLAIHHTALNMFALAYYEWCPDETPITSIGKYEFTLKYGREQASRTQARHLIISGHCTYDRYIQHIPVSDAVTFRGCLHAFNTIALDYLLQMEGIRTVNFECGPDFKEKELDWLHHDLCWMQRSRVVTGRQEEAIDEPLVQAASDCRPYKLFRCFVNLPQDVCAKYERLWDAQEDHYTCGARVEVIPRKFNWAKTVLDTDQRAWREGVAWPFDTGAESSAPAITAPDATFDATQSPFCNCDKSGNDEGYSLIEDYVPPPSWIMSHKHFTDDEMEYEQQAQDRLELAYDCWRWYNCWDDCLRCGEEWDNVEDDVHQCWWWRDGKNDGAKLARL